MIYVSMISLPLQPPKSSFPTPSLYPTLNPPRIRLENPIYPVIKAARVLLLVNRRRVVPSSWISRFGNFHSSFGFRIWGYLRWNQRRSSLGSVGSSPPVVRISSDDLSLRYLVNS